MSPGGDVRESMRDSRRDSQELLCSSQNCTQKRINFTVRKKTYKLIKIEMLFFFLKYRSSRKWTFGIIDVLGGK